MKEQMETAATAQEWVMIVAGPRDGEWLKVDPGQASIVVSAGRIGPLQIIDAGMEGRLGHIVTYVRCTLSFEDGSACFFRPETMTDRQALLWLIGVHRNRRDEKPSRNG
jgi:hypothetical protein